MRSQVAISGVLWTDSGTSFQQVPSHILGLGLEEVRETELHEEARGKRGKQNCGQRYVSIQL